MRRLKPSTKHDRVLTTNHILKVYFYREPMTIKDKIFDIRMDLANVIIASVIIVGVVTREVTYGLRTVDQP